MVSVPVLSIRDLIWTGVFTLGKGAINEHRGSAAQKAVQTGLEETETCVWIGNSQWLLLQYQEKKKRKHNLYRTENVFINLAYFDQWTSQAKLYFCDF